MFFTYSNECSTGTYIGIIRRNSDCTICNTLILCIYASKLLKGLLQIRIVCNFGIQIIQVAKSTNIKKIAKNQRCSCVSWRYPAWQTFPLVAFNIKSRSCTIVFYKGMTVELVKYIIMSKTSEQVLVAFWETEQA